MFIHTVLAIYLLLFSGCQSTNKKDVDHPKLEAKEHIPLLTRPAVRRLWIPDKIDDDGKTLDAEHWRYFLDREATWAK